MLQKKIEFRQRLALGDIVTFYFDFLKQNFKSFTNIFISYNGVFILAFLGISYLLVTGFLGLVNAEGSNSEIESGFYLAIGGIAFFVIFVLVAALNYSLSSTFISEYVKSKTIEVDKKTVWQIVYHNIGKIIVFILMLILIYTAFIIISVILAIIPIIGSLAQYVLNFGITSWIGVSFMVLLHEKQGVSDSFSEGWRLVTKNFWKCIGVNFILGLLVGILILLVLSIPGFIIGIYAFHAVDTGVDIGNSVVAKIVWIIAVWILLIVSTYSQALSQFINGILYFSLHEQTYNEHTRAKIEQIGSEI